MVDPHRPGHELTYFPGRVNLLLADVVVINKIDTAAPEGVEAVRASIRALNPRAAVVDAASPIPWTAAEASPGKRVLVVEDGPTLTHGEMTLRGRASWPPASTAPRQIVDPRPVRHGQDPADLREVPGHRRAAAGGGLRGRAGARPGGHHPTRCPATW